MTIASALKLLKSKTDERKRPLQLFEIKIISMLPQEWFTTSLNLASTSNEEVQSLQGSTYSSSGRTSLYFPSHPRPSLYKVVFEVDWSKVDTSIQTLFPVYARKKIELGTQTFQTSTLSTTSQSIQKHCNDVDKLQEQHTLLQTCSSQRPLKRSIHKGKPPMDAYFTLRAIRNVPMNPPFLLSIIPNSNSFITKGNCICNREPIVSEHETSNFIVIPRGLLGRLKRGIMELTNLSIGS